METKQIGVVCVDSGNLMLVDPLYLDDWEKPNEDSNVGHNFGYNQIATETAKKLQHQNRFAAGHDGLAFTVRCDDGEYAVMAETDGKVVKKIWIEFD